jgi:hypothetical protein
MGGGVLLAPAPCVRHERFDFLAGGSISACMRMACKARSSSSARDIFTCLGTRLAQLGPFWASAHSCALVRTRKGHVFKVGTTTRYRYECGHPLNYELYHRFKRESAGGLPPTALLPALNHSHAHRHIHTRAHRCTCHAPRLQYCSRVRLAACCACAAQALTHWRACIQGRRPNGRP